MLVEWSNRGATLLTWGFMEAASLEDILPWVRHKYRPFNMRAGMGKNIHVWK